MYNLTYNDNVAHLFVHDACVVEFTDRLLDIILQCFACLPGCETLWNSDLSKTSSSGC